MTPSTRKQAYDEMIDTLCSIHRVNVDEAGLSDYGKRGEVVPARVDGVHLCRASGSV